MITLAKAQGSQRRNKGFLIFSLRLGAFARNKFSLCLRASVVNNNHAGSDRYTVPFSTFTG